MVAGQSALRATAQSGAAVAAKRRHCGRPSLQQPLLLGLPGQPCHVPRPPSCATGDIGPTLMRASQHHGSVSCCCPAQGCCLQFGLVQSVTVTKGKGLFVIAVRRLSQWSAPVEASTPQLHTDRVSRIDGDHVGSSGRPVSRRCGPHLLL